MTAAENSLSTIGVEPWRLQVLNWSSKGLALAGLIWTFSFAFRDEYVGVRAYYLLIPLVLLPAAIDRLGYRLRSIFLVASFFSILALATWVGGPAPGAVMAALLASVSAGFLFGVRTSLYVWLLTACTFALGLYSTSHAASPFDVGLIDPRTPINRSRLIATYVILSGTMAIGVSFVVNRLGRSLHEARVAEHKAQKAQKEAETLGDERQKALSQLIEAQKFQVLAQLSGGIAHDVNNSLQILMTYSEILREDSPSREEIEELASEMHEVCCDTSTLARQLLTLGKKVVLDARVLDLGHEVEQASPSLMKLLPADVELRLDCQSSLSARVDSVQLKQALLNLVLNAIHAMPQGGILRVEVKEREDKQIVLSVTDTGSGIKDETLSSIFEPFFSTKGSHGTGLGLPTVKAIMEQHEGEIFVKSELGRGTCVELCFPKETGAHTEKTSGVHKKQDLRGWTILVADDDSRILSAVARLLASSGAEVLTCRDAGEAIEKSKSFDDSIDVLVADAVMPGLPTRKLLDHFEDTRPSAGIVICSAYVDSDLTHRGLAGDDYCRVTKPFTSDSLIREVRSSKKRAERKDLAHTPHNDVTTASVKTRG